MIAKPAMGLLGALTLALAACGAEQPAAPGAPAANAPAPTAMLDEDPSDPADSSGVYTGTVGGKPGFMIAFQTQHAPPDRHTVLGITQRDGDVGAFIGGGLSPKTPNPDFTDAFGGTFAIGGISDESLGVVLAGSWSLGGQFKGSVTKYDSNVSVLDFDLRFDPISLSAEPAGNAMPAGTYDILNDGVDIGDYNVATPGAATGSVTWPGASKACEIGVSTAVRAPGTKRNVWLIQFNTDVECTPSVWSIGYASAAPGSLTYEIFGSRALSVHGRSAPAGEPDAMHLQLRRRS